MKDLSIIIEIFLRPLQAACLTSKPLITSKQINTIFSNIEILYQYSQDLHESLVGFSVS